VTKEERREEKKKGSEMTIGRANKKEWKGLSEKKGGRGTNDCIANEKIFC
jgi:hypothetical protein